MLANRLKKVVGKVVSKAQGALIEGRQILNAVLIANEAIDSVLKNTENGILCKLDTKEGIRQCGLIFSSHSYAKNGFWGEMD